MEAVPSETCHSLSQTIAEMSSSARSVLGALKIIVLYKSRAIVENLIVTLLVLHVLCFFSELIKCYSNITAL